MTSSSLEDRLEQALSIVGKQAELIATAGDTLRILATADHEDCVVLLKEMAEIFDQFKDVRYEL